MLLYLDIAIFIVKSMPYMVGNFRVKVNVFSIFYHLFFYFLSLPGTVMSTCLMLHALDTHYYNLVSSNYKMLVLVGLVIVV